MRKSVPLKVKPQRATPDDWVGGDTLSSAKSQLSAKFQPDNVPMKRLTIDISEELHTEIKATCAARRVKMSDEIRKLLEEHFSVKE